MIPRFLRLFTFFLSLSSSHATSKYEQTLEHVVIIDGDHPSPPHVSTVMQRIQLHCEHPAVRAVFNNSAFTGFAAMFTPEHALHLNNMSDVLLVEQSVSVQHTGLIKRDTTNSRPYATWGLSRISNPFFDGTIWDTLEYDYSYQGESLGDGVDIYIVDTGIFTDHDGFQGRAKMIWSLDANMTDDNGHGTHVAGTAGAMDFGVASNANIFGVKVLDITGGSSSTVISGIDAVVKQHDSRKSNKDFVGSVMSLSLAASAQVDAMNQAIVAATKAGIHVCVAAGNSAQDACSASPASAGGDKGPAISVGSVGIGGQPSSFSNYGSCVDVYAPGEEILSAATDGPKHLVFLSGTSQATPHVTGLVAYAMKNATLARDPGLMKQWIKSQALPMTGGIVLAYNGAGDTGQGMLGISKVEVPSNSAEFHT